MISFQYELNTCVSSSRLLYRSEISFDSGEKTNIFRYYKNALLLFVLQPFQFFTILYQNKTHTAMKTVYVSGTENFHLVLG